MVDSTRIYSIRPDKRPNTILNHRKLEKRKEMKYLILLLLSTSCFAGMEDRQKAEQLQTQCMKQQGATQDKCRVQTRPEREKNAKERFIAAQPSARKSTH